MKNNYLLYKKNFRVVIRYIYRFYKQFTLMHYLKKVTSIYTLYFLIIRHTRI